MNDYRGLGGYAREKPDPTEQRPGESPEAHQRRIAPYLRHAAEAAEDESWTQHRARVDAAPTGAGLFARATPQERAQAAGTLGFGGDQKVQPTGHLNWEANHGQPGVSRVYASQLGEGKPAVSPLVAHLRSSNEGDWC